MRKKNLLIYFHYFKELLTKLNLLKQTVPYSETYLILT